MSNPIRLDQQVVVVTGAGQGVGRAHALELARRGARVVVNDLGTSPAGEGANPSLADKVAAEIRAAGGEAIANGDSVATAAGGAAIVEAALAQWGRLDAVVHNAGILRDASFAKLKPAQLESVLAVHLLGAFHVMQPAFRFMKEHGGGRLVLTTSASGLFGNFGQANYCAAKMGMVGLMRVLAIEGARYGIKANALAPVAATRLTGAPGEDDAGVLSPARIAAIIPLLCHAQCPASGEIIQAGGGWFARVQVAVTEGWVAGADELNAEAIRDHWSAIRDGETTEVADALAIGDLLARKLGVGSLDFDQP